ncbi:DUF624 domain-containing protein [Halomontanus rarus]|uniref:DUF624 domain-containing protein n=1 Tax=Halomontanus rarus TaxID=3034020 RepID=UPI0023E779E4|nr:DUF624 domain-containing protein [Halovivax sp. TS33]
MTRTRDGTRTRSHTRVDPFDPELDPVYAACRRTTRFVWDNLVSIVGISLAWFLAALPVVTIGPATVGAYRAVLSLRGDGPDRVDRSAVVATVRSQFVHATLIGLVPVVVLTVAGTYAVTYLAGGPLFTGALALVGVYGGLYAWLVSIPTLLGLAEGEAPADAFAEGYRWTARHGVGAVALGVVTIGLFVATTVLTVGVALLFAGCAFAFHVEFVTGVTETERLPTSEGDR